MPRAGFSWVTHKLKGSVAIPLVATNRINTPEIAEQVLAQGHADMVSMARPFLADPFFVQKAAEGREDEINTCIACNQARHAPCLAPCRALCASHRAVHCVHRTVPCTVHRIVHHIVHHIV